MALIVDTLRLQPMLSLGIPAVVAALRITALTEGILRVRIAPDGALPQDDSWAVLPQMQRQSVPVVHVPAGDGRLHFATVELDVTATLDPLHLQHTACKLGHPLLYEGRRI